MDNFKSHKDEFEKLLAQKIPVALEAIGEFVQGEAGDELERSPTRVDTGHLRGSIDYHVDAQEEAVYIGTNVEYAVYVHEGTGIYHPNGRRTKWRYKDDKGKWHTTQGMPPNRFLKNACVRNKKQIAQYLRDNIKF